ncbi:hypothetical protein QN219_00795 [Sinorhizobium sp. 7-81]|uniref:hypothetical protein n=1 Tax=Sinorhizobium sp. 8-89 TaxID=3049089 RepID=UPI0024C439B7|nr:hypothetical protein [Sinorhizobium sp. 8-89]MDK1488604.1 hypothetical protein [Sinorhizobium sp. 8-89]
MNAMNQREELKDKPLIDPVTGQPTPRDPEVSREPETRGRWSGRSSWPLLIILLAGLVLALIAWLPAELTRDTEEATPPPATSDQSTTQPAPTDQATPPAGEATPGTPPAPETPAAPATPPATPAPQPQTAPAQPAQ